MHRLKGILVLLVAVGLMAAAGLRAQQEHPQEHPKAEHPTTKPVSMSDLEKAIRAHIEDTAKAHQGKFPVKDDVLNKTWALTLVKVHTDKLTQLTDTIYFACVDFKADDGTPVDVDFYLKSEEGKLKVTDTTVHKINGQPRFQYQRRGDFWERVSTEQPAQKHEHPNKAEHPKKPEPPK